VAPVDLTVTGGVGSAREQQPRAKRREVSASRDPADCRDSPLQAVATIKGGIPDLERITWSRTGPVCSPNPAHSREPPDHGMNEER
jgi:hypothetical protein